MENRVAFTVTGLSAAGAGEKTGKALRHQRGGYGGFQPGKESAGDLRHGIGTGRSGGSDLQHGF